MLATFLLAHLCRQPPARSKDGAQARHVRPDHQRQLYVTDSREIATAFEKHLEIYGGLDICINSAGIGTIIPFHKDPSDGTDNWRRTINVNLIALIDCTRIAVCILFNVCFANLSVS